jgi:outer membrane autotransporter protein
MPVDGDFTVGSRELSYSSLHAGYAYLFERDNWYLQPGLDLGWIGLSGDGFHESGNSPTALWVKHGDENFLTSRAEIMLGGEIHSDSNTIYRPFLRTAYTHLFTGTTGEIQARLAGAPDGVGYFTQVLPFDDNFTSLDLGLDLFMGEKWTVRLTYERQYASSWDAKSFFAKVFYGM